MCDSPVARPEDFADADDRTVLIRASSWVALGLSTGLANGPAHPFVFEPAEYSPENESLVPGEIRVGVLPETLLGFSYLSVAIDMAAQDDLENCEECRLPFVVEDKRQRFCTKTCAGRARFRRFQEKSAKRKGRKHGKTTRKR